MPPFLPSLEGAAPSPTSSLSSLVLVLLMFVVGTRLRDWVLLGEMRPGGGVEKVFLASLSSLLTREERSWLWVEVEGEEVTEIGEELIRCLILSFVRFDLLLSLRPFSYSQMALSADMSS